MGHGAIGGTFCYPLIGPVERLDHSLSEAELLRVRAHEDAHAAQCRREGAVWHNLRRILPRQRLQAETDAYCAEVRMMVNHGAPARLEYARVEDELNETKFFRLESKERSAALESQCPDLAAQAATEEAEWMAHLRRRPEP
jgi:hypothetical protein